MKEMKAAEQDEIEPRRKASYLTNDQQIADISREDLPSLIPQSLGYELPRRSLIS